MRLRDVWQANSLKRLSSQPEGLCVFSARASARRLAMDECQGLSISTVERRPSSSIRAFSSGRVNTRPRPA